ncbi:MAG TPA: homocysteine biosynthesis protein [Candidatus Methanofastidiosa archaeon]|nr:homocysteine biosynthesis protein [Candidatus Methanofastidiosa archaeon]HPR42015.1 homocysteine biosynthesis protein [Candidatus Methanofastidiosa archaeon]
MKNIRTYDEINNKIESGEAVVVTAEEIIGIVEEDGIKRAAEYVDVVTTGTFSPMCSSGIFLNFGHSDPPIRMQKILLNDVPAHGGLAAVDTYLGATSESLIDQRVGGSHVIEELVKGREVKLSATSKGTDCYPRTEINTWIDLNEVNDAIMYNPRNCYQNYNVAVNASGKSIKTYMGTLLPNLGNAHFSTSGQLSPLLNDPEFRTIGVGTRILLCGAQGYVSWNGTQHNPNVEEVNGHKMYFGGTISVMGDLKKMSPDLLRAAYLPGYGVSIFIGVGVPIPILNEDVMKNVSVRDEDIYTKVVDYSIQRRDKSVITYVNYGDLRAGHIEIDGMEVRASSISSYAKARDICNILKKDIGDGTFRLQEPIQDLPIDVKYNNLKVK